MNGNKVKYSVRNQFRIILNILYGIFLYSKDPDDSKHLQKDKQAIYWSTRKILKHILNLDLDPNSFHFLYISYAVVSLKIFSVEMNPCILAQPPEDVVGDGRWQSMVSNLFSVRYFFIPNF